MPLNISPAGSARKAVKSVHSGNGNAKVTSCPAQKYPFTAAGDSFGWRISGLEQLDAEITELTAGVHPEDVRKQQFNVAMGCVIAFNAVVMALEVDLKPDEDSPVQDKVLWIIFESSFCVIFIAEIFVRVWWDGLAWLCHLANAFDVVLVVCMVIDAWLLPILSANLGPFRLLSLLRLLRLLRLIRLLRIMKFCHAFYMIANAFGNALRKMVWLCLMMVCGLFLTSIFTTSMIGKSKTFRDVDMGGWSGSERFGTVFKSMYSLFELMTLEGWVHVGRPLVSRQPAMFLFLFAFIMTFTFGLLNMIVAMVVEATITEAKKLDQMSDKEVRHHTAEVLRNMRDAFSYCDSSGTGEISWQDFESAIKKDECVQTCLDALGIPVHDARELFQILDTDGNRLLNVEEFVSGCSRLRNPEISKWDAVATYAGVRKLLRQIPATPRAPSTSLEVPLPPDNPKAMPMCCSQTSHTSDTPSNTFRVRGQPDHRLPGSLPQPCSGSDIGSDIGDLDTDNVQESADIPKLCLSDDTSIATPGANGVSRVGSHIKPEQCCSCCSRVLTKLVEQSAQQAEILESLSTMKTEQQELKHMVHSLMMIANKPMAFSAIPP